MGGEMQKSMNENCVEPVDAASASARRPWSTPVIIQSVLAESKHNANNLSDGSAFSSAGKAHS